MTPRSPTASRVSDSQYRPPESAARDERGKRQVRRGARGHLQTYERGER